jgi:hypothetical protein
MPPNPFVQLPASTALGATVLGLSATLFAVDVGATFAIGGDASTHLRPPAEVARIAAPVPLAVPHAVRAAEHERAAQRLVMARTRNADPDPVAVFAVNVRPADWEAHVRPAPLAAMLVRVRPSTSVRQPIVPRITIALADARAALAASGASGAHRPAGMTAPSPITLREVRRFVMRALNRSKRHVCIISAMTYPTDGRRVVVDLVFRDDTGRWSEKAVVRRGVAALKLIGVKQRALPYKTVAAAVIPPEIVSAP